VTSQPGDDEHPTNDDIMYDFPPLYDVYGDEEECLEETKSGIIIWDNENEEEEYPIFHSDPRFLDPTYSKGDSQEEPKFDEDPIYDNEEFRVLGGMNRALFVAQVATEGVTRAKD
jgi:hypothetical protein